jgi:hypothetical protein
MRFVSYSVVSSRVPHICRSEGRTLSISCWSLRAAIVTGGRRRGVLAVQPYRWNMDALCGRSRRTSRVWCGSVGSPEGRGICFVLQREFECFATVALWFRSSLVDGIGGRRECSGTESLGSAGPFGPRPVKDVETHIGNGCFLLLMQLPT